MNDMTMGQRIAEQRKKLGLSQEGLGEKVGVSRQAISKWESDGTVPEIDKLISLSRLFSVSVGWLLGVEEDTPPQPDDLTESQLKMVEEIVRRYQPQPEKKKFPWAIAIAVFAGILALAALLWNPGSSQDYSGQISSLQSNYQTIQNELASLSGRVEDIASAAEEGEKLLQNYEFRLIELSAGGMELDVKTERDPPDDTPVNSIVTVDMPTAVLTFTAVPKQHVDTDKAWLTVLLEGKQLGLAECTWQGAGYAAELTLWRVDGYEYRFVVEHEDGTQQIQVLEEYDYSNLAYGTSLHCTAESYTFGYDPRTWTFVIDNCYISAEKPNLGNFADARWVESGLILYQNGEELERRTESDEDNPENYELIREYYDFNFRNVKLEEGDELELTFYAALDNGMSKETTIGCWSYRDGTLISLTEA